MPRRIFRLVPTTCIFDTNISLVGAFYYCSGDKSEKNEMDGHVAYMGEKRGVYRVLVRKPEKRGHLEDPGVDGRILLR